MHGIVHQCQLLVLWCYDHESYHGNRALGWNWPLVFRSRNDFKVHVFLHLRLHLHADDIIIAAADDVLIAAGDDILFSQTLYLVLI